MVLPDVDDLASYGPVNDYGYIADPLIERSQADVAKACCSLGGITQTAERALLTFTFGGAYGTHDAAWASPVAPTPTVNGTGDITWTWPTTVIDELGNAHTLVIRYAECQYSGAIANVTTSALVVGNNAVRCRAWSSGSPSSLTGDNLVLAIY